LPLCLARKCPHSPCSESIPSILRLYESSRYRNYRKRTACSCK
jgi:hypothetical protein